MHPPGRRKKFGGVNYGKIVTAPPSRDRSEVGEIWKVRVVNFAVLACLSRAMTKNKGHQLFEEKSAPPEKFLATPMQTR